MKIRIEEIPFKGLDINGFHSKKELEDLFLERGDEFKPLSDLTFELKVNRSGRDLLIEGRFQVDLGLTCIRCLENFLYPLAQEFTTYLSPWGERMPFSHQSHQRFKKGEADCDFYHGEEIDVLDLLRSEMILSIPFYPLCSEVCRGLCPICGGNPNLKECLSCDRESEVSNSSFSALKSLLI